MHHSKYWAYHLGKNALGGNKPQSQKTIGIELSNYGPLTLRNGNLETAYSRTKKHPNRVDIYCKESDTDKYHKLETPYRGYRYYTSYTDKQYEQLAVLIKFLCAKYNIPAQLLPKEKRFEHTKAVSYTHLTLPTTPYV